MGAPLSKTLTESPEAVVTRNGAVCRLGAAGSLDSVSGRSVNRSPSRVPPPGRSLPGLSLGWAPGAANGERPSCAGRPSIDSAM